MSRHVLAPTDFTVPSERAVRYAADLAEATGGTLELAHVCTVGPELASAAEAPAKPEPAAAEEASAQEASRTRLQALAGEFSARGIPTTVTVIRPTEPAVALLDAAADADLVVIATRGTSGDQPGLGSVATAMARHAQVPVLVVGPDVGRIGTGLRILVPVDLSEASATALRAARALAAALDGTVDVVHAIPDEAQASVWGGEPVADDAPEAERRLRYVERFVTESGGPEATVRIHLAEGHPDEAVARVARDERTDLVVAGRPHDRPTALDRLLDAASRAARCPSLRVPA